MKELLQFVAENSAIAFIFFFFTLSFIYAIVSVVSKNIADAIRGKPKDDDDE